MAASGTEGNILLWVQFFGHRPRLLPLVLLLSPVCLPAMPYVSVPPILSFRALDGLGNQIVGTAVVTGGVPVWAAEAALKIPGVFSVHYAHPHRNVFTQPGKGSALTKRTHPRRS